MNDRASSFELLPRSFYERPVLAVARELLNKVVVCGECSGRIVEVEAYRQDDPASHSFAGPRERTRTMFRRGGLLYVYFTYGLHWCMNAVCGPEGYGAAVLLRALEPIDGLPTMRDRRLKARSDRELCSGPARLTQALAVDRSFDGEDLTVAGRIGIGDDGVLPPHRVGRSPRIGISKAKEKPWRLFVVGSDYLSRR